MFGNVLVINKLLQFNSFRTVPQERLANIGPEEFVQTFIPRDEADLRVRLINMVSTVTVFFLLIS